MRVITLNVNGIRAAARKGLYPWLARQRADVVCLQETRAQPDQLGDRCFHPRNFHCVYHSGERRGYAGVAIYSRREPDRIVEGFAGALGRGGDAAGWAEFDREGRYVEAQFDGLSVVSLYAPSGSSKDERQQAKLRFLERFDPLLRGFRRRRREYIICGDWNMAHRDIDLTNFRANRNHPGFTPEERAWMDELLGSRGYVDAFRAVNPDPGHYTWWSTRGRAWEKNVGWRIDYQIVTPGLREAIRGASIYRNRRFSDHAPLTVDYEI